MSMRRYEVVFVLAPQLTEDEVKTQVETYSNVAVEKGAKVLHIDEWGKRRLAFPVKKNKEGIYVILTLEEGSADAVTELERRFRVSDAIIRFLTVRVDEDLKRADKFGNRRRQRKGLPAKPAPPVAAEPAAVSKTDKPAPVAEEAPAEEAPAEEAPAEEAPVEEVAEAPAAEVPAAEEAPEESEPAAVEAAPEEPVEAPAEEAASEEAPPDPEPVTEEAPADEPAPAEVEEETKDAETVEEK